MKIRNDGTVSRLLRDVPLPRMFHASQQFPDAHIDREDIEKTIFDEISRSGITIASTFRSEQTMYAQLIRYAGSANSSTFRRMGPLVMSMTLSLL